jgi:hypothetical protein
MRKGLLFLYLLQETYLKLFKIIFHQEMGPQWIQGASSSEEDLIFLLQLLQKTYLEPLMILLYQGIFPPMDPKGQLMRRVTPFPLYTSGNKCGVSQDFFPTRGVFSMEQGVSS